MALAAPTENDVRNARYFEEAGGDSGHLIAPGSGEGPLVVLRWKRREGYGCRETQFGGGFGRGNHSSFVFRRFAHNDALLVHGLPVP